MNQTCRSRRILTSPAAVERVLKCPIGTGEDLLLIRKHPYPTADIPELNRYSIILCSGNGQIGPWLTLTADEWMRHSVTPPIPCRQPEDDYEWYETGVDPSWRSPADLSVYVKHCRTTIYDDYDVVDSEEMIFSANELARIGTAIAKLLGIDYAAWIAHARAQG